MNWEWIGRPRVKSASSRDVEWMQARRWLLVLPPALTVWLARKRRQLGWYDMLTLWMFRSGWLRLRTPASHLAYLSFRQDLGFGPRPATARHLEAPQGRLPPALRKGADLLLETLRSSEHGRTRHDPSEKGDDANRLHALSEAIVLAARGRGVCVVGNSPSIGGLKLGATIDRAHLVVRFNACFGAQSLEVDTGSRIDIWVRSPAFAGTCPPGASWRVISGPRAVAGAGQFEGQRGSVTIPLEIWRELVLELRAPPSAGLLMLWWLHRICGGWTGISVAAVGTANGKHRDERSRGRSMFRHDWQAERRLLQRWVTSGLTQLDRDGKRKVVVATSFRLARIPRLKQLVDAEVIYRPIGVALSRSTAVLTWGKTPGERRAAMIAGSVGLPTWRLEDGFLRSIELGAREPPLSVVMDDIGIYYDAAHPSRLEALVMQPLSALQEVRVAELIKRWRMGRISKYNHLREYSGQLPARYILVADQTWGDASIRFGLADADSFERMLQAALAENPDCEVLVKTHPDVFAGKKRGHFDRPMLADRQRVTVLAQDVHPVRLLENAEAVYTVTSQIGFEGLLWGKRVRTFGMPFYAGWGLTADSLPPPVRRAPVTLHQLVNAALIAYPTYVDPETGDRCEPERLVAWISLQRRMRERFAPVVYGVGFSLWKRPLVEDFLQGSEVRFVAKGSDIPAGATLAVWGREPAPPGTPDSVALMRMEDGFLRSVGLGADLVRPLSWVQDQSGIYYDPSQPSDLELLLQSGVFDEELLARARTLRLNLLKSGLTKYNLTGPIWKRPAGLGNRRVLLVPGQVESDASIRWGGTMITSNEALLSHVRRRNPYSYVVYKPHPDVVAKLRRGQSDGGSAPSWCDEMVSGVSMAELLSEVDEVHTITSLAGFEGLLRDKKVCCYGQPFYAGWGLTEDCELFAPKRRSRRLTLDELVAGVLLVYPSYVSFATRRFTTAEQTLAELVNLRKNNKQSVTNRIFRAVVRGGLVLRARLSKK